MTLPGSVVEIIDAAPPAAALTDTGTAFVVGLADRGTLTGQLTNTDAVNSLSEWKAKYGERMSYNGPEYDAVEAHFSEGGSRLFWSRYNGPAAAKAQITIPAAGSQFTAVAKSEGDWANDVDVAITAGVITVREAGTVVETSPVQVTVGDAQTWATQNSKFVDLNPLVATTTAISASAARTLTGGVDDRTNATDTQRTAALARFGSDLGPGSVLLPGDTRTQAHSLLATHARDTNRFAYGDGPDSSAAGTVAAVGTTARGLGTELARHIQIVAPWLTVGTASGSTKSIPPSGVMAGMAARNDAAGNPNRAVAGRNGTSRTALDVKYSWTDTDRETLADAGITVIRNIRGAVQAYDDVTPVNETVDPEWLGAAGNRLVMRIIADAYAIADSHMFGSVSGQVDLAAFEGDLKGMLAGWFSLFALYSSDGTPAGAFRVEAGPSVNTAETLAARQLKAALALKISPNARQVIVQITNTPLTQAL